MSATRKWRESRDFSLFETSKRLSIGELIRRLQHPRFDVRRSAAQQLHFRGGRRGFSVARRLCRSTQPSDRDIGAYLLGQLGVPDRPFAQDSLPLLRELLGDKSRHVRASAAAAIGHLKCPEGVKSLVLLVDDRSTLVRSHVAFALGVLGGEEAQSALEKLSRDKDSEVREWAMLYLKDPEA